MSQELVGQPERPAAGWFPSEQLGYERWWNGTEWTELQRPIAQAMAPREPYVQPAAVGTAVSMQQTTDQRTSTVEITLGWIFAVLTLGYMLPWAIAATRGKSNSVAVALVNLLLGWTLVGWAVALIMACTAHRQRMNMVQLVNTTQHYQGHNNG